MNCPRCNTIQDMNAQFCGNCGAELRGAQGVTMRSIQFSGNNWIVKDSNEERLGPGPNFFSSSPENVWIDSEGQLHLKITNRNNHWYCAEVSLEKPLGYGTYEFFVNGRFDQLDSNIVVGLFLYKDDAHEIDIEFGRWGRKYGDNLQYVLQACPPGSIHRYQAELNGDYTTHRIVWKPESVSFRSLHGHYLGDLPSKYHLITQWAYGNAYYTPTTEKVHMNLWLVQGESPVLGKETEIVITRFAFQ